MRDTTGVPRASKRHRPPGGHRQRPDRRGTTATAPRALRLRAHGPPPSTVRRRPTPRSASPTTWSTGSDCGRTHRATSTRRSRARLEGCAASCVATRWGPNLRPTPGNEGAAAPAPTPLSMLTVTTPASKLCNMEYKAPCHRRPTRKPVEVGRYHGQVHQTGDHRRQRALHPATTTSTSAPFSRIRVRGSSSRCSPATPTSYRAQPGSPCGSSPGRPPRRPGCPRCRR